MTSVDPIWPVVFTKSTWIDSISNSQFLKVTHLTPLDLTWPHLIWFHRTSLWSEKILAYMLLPIMNLLWIGSSCFYLRRGANQNYRRLPLIFISRTLINKNTNLTIKLFFFKLLNIYFINSDDFGNPSFTLSFVGNGQGK